MIKYQEVSKYYENDCSSLSLKPSKLELLVNQFNNATTENNNGPEKITLSSKYYDMEEMHNIKIPHKNKELFLFHINACSFNKNFDDLKHLLSCAKKIDIIAISETRITKQVSLLNNLNINNYFFEFAPAETSAGGIPFYIANHLSCKCKNELESTFIENVNLRKSNIIVGVIYRHPSLNYTDFNCNYFINKHLESISKEQK